MRRYHPDADPSIEAARRAQEINAAYAALSNPERRARYDGTIEAQRLIRPDRLPPERTFRSYLPRPAPAAAILFSAIAAGLVAIAVWPPLADRAGLSLPKSEQQAAQPTKLQAQSQQNAAAAHLPTRVPRPPAAAQSKIAPAKAEPPALPAEPTKVVKPVPTLGPKPVAAPVPETRKPAAAAKAAIPCSLGNGITEKTICGSTNLTALDRQASLLYNQSWKQASETKRTALLVSRASFNERRSMCETESCLTSAYVARLREISDIMAGRGQQP
jgi:curved DNA-binding protein CbpA